MNVISNNFSLQTKNLIPMNSLITSEGKQVRELKLILNEGKNGYTEDKTFKDLKKWIKKNKLNVKGRGFFIQFKYDDKFIYNINPHFQTYKNLSFISLFAKYEKKKVLNRINQISIFYADLPTKNEGGDDKNNNCLYYAIKSFLLDRMKHKTPYKFKQFLGLKKDEKVHIDLLPKIEEKYGINIYLSGDFNYKPSKKILHYENVYLTLINGHYEANKKPFDKSYIVYSEPLPLIIAYSDNHKIYFWNGKENLTTKPKNAHIIKKDIDEDYKEIYDKTKKEYEIMAENTNYNPLKFRDLNNLIKKIIYDTIKNYEWEEIHPDEAEIIKKCGMGAVRFAETGIYNHCYSFDLNRYYSHLQKNLNVPTSRPEFLKIEKLPKILSPGFYKCNIEQGLKFFNYNIYGWYTQYDINYIRKNHPEIKISIDNEADFNNLCYKKSYCNFNKFNNIYNTFYNLYKNNNCKVAKTVANMVWGMCCSRDFTKHKLEENKPIVFNPNSDNIKQKNTSYILKKYSIHNYFKFPYARVGPFLVSKGRATINEAIIKDFKINDIKYINTDGFISQTIPKNFKSSDKMGGLRLEYEIKKIHIKNKNDKIILE